MSWFPASRRVNNGPNSQSFPKHLGQRVESVSEDRKSQSLRGPRTATGLGFILLYPHVTGLLQITVRLDVKRIIAEGEDAAVFFELQTKAPAEATVLVAEWHQFRNGKISRAQSAFDARPYEAMFTGGKPN